MGDLDQLHCSIIQKMYPSNVSSNTVQTNADTAIAIGNADSGNSSVGQPVIAQANRTSVTGLQKAWINSHYEEITDQAFDQLLEELTSPSCTIETLNLQGAKIGDERAVRLAQALEKNGSVKELALYHNKIGDRGAKALSEMLKKTNTLRELDLHKNHINTQGLKDLAEALKTNNTLLVIRLDENHFDDQGIAALADALKLNSGLKSLSLIGSVDKGEIGPIGAKFLGEALAVNTSLASVDLYHNEIGQAGAAYLADALRANKSIKFLRLDSNNIDAHACVKLLGALSHNKVLEELHLGYNPLGNLGFQFLAKALASNRLRVRTLDLSCSSKVENAALANLAKGLEHNKSLKTLNLSYLHGVNHEGIGKLVSALKKNQTLTTLDLVLLTQNEAGLQVIKDLFSSNKTIFNLKLDARSEQSEIGKAIKRAANRNKIPHVVALDLITRCRMSGRSAGQALPAPTIPLEILEIIASFIEADSDVLV